MKSKLTLALAVSILTIGLSAFSNRADAQAPFAANTHSTSVTLPLGGIGTINVIELPEVGTYVISGQQNLSASPTTAQTPVLCYMTTQPGGSTPLPSGPYSMTTIPSEGGYLTLPLNGYYTATSSPMNLWVVCRYFGQGQVSAIYGNITATRVQ
jgi:hypothetical protein